MPADIFDVGDAIFFGGKLRVDLNDVHGYPLLGQLKVSRKGQKLSRGIVYLKLGHSQFPAKIMILKGRGTNIFGRREPGDAAPPYSAAACSRRRP
jgi:hypothetical protein